MQLCVVHREPSFDLDLGERNGMGEPVLLVKQKKASVAAAVLYKTDFRRRDKFRDKGMSSLRRHNRL